MAASDRLGYALSIASVTLPIALAPACAQVTGLSDDYQYDLVDGSAGQEQDASTTKDGGAQAADAAREGGAAGDRCSAAERSEAQATIGQAGGDGIPAQCRMCLATNCCDEIATCGQQDECTQSMKCIFGCQKNGNKSQCINGCRSTFATKVGSCIQRYCASPTCQLQ
jgi:hypothetical protein